MELTPFDKVLISNLNKGEILMNNKAIVIYYSLSGNTKKIAELIKDKTGADIEEIQTLTPYTGDYNSIVEQGHKEINNGYKPKIKQISADLSEYNTVILGTPVWWYTMAPAVFTFLSENSLDGKKVIPFATNGGWIGHTFKDIKKLCANSELGEEMDIAFSGNKLATSENKIEKWISTFN